jgi:hypothetical protein
LVKTSEIESRSFAVSTPIIWIERTRSSSTNINSKGRSYGKALGVFKFNIYISMDNSATATAAAISKTAATAACYCQNVKLQQALWRFPIAVRVELDNVYARNSSIVQNGKTGTCRNDNLTISAAASGYCTT